MSTREQNILACWQNAEQDFPDKSTEFLMEIACQYYHVMTKRRIDCSDVADVLVKQPIHNEP